MAGEGWIGAGKSIASERGSQTSLQPKPSDVRRRGESSAVSGIECDMRDVIPTPSRLGMHTQLRNISLRFLTVQCSVVESQPTALTE